MNALWAVVLVLLIFVLIGGFAVNNWIFLLLFLVLILALVGAF